MTMVMTNEQQPSLQCEGRRFFIFLFFIFYFFLLGWQICFVMLAAILDSRRGQEDRRWQ